MDHWPIKTGAGSVQLHSQGTEDVSGVVGSWGSPVPAVILLPRILIRYLNGAVSLIELPIAAASVFPL